MINAQTNTSFLDKISPSIKTQILSNIATHYGITEAEAYEEVTEEGAENLLDYLTGSVRTATSCIMQRQ